MSSTGRRWAVTVDAASAVALLGLLLWSASTERAPGDARPLLLLLLLGAVTYSTARAANLLHPLLVPGVVAVAATGLAIVSADTLLGGPLDSPLGYSNATGAFYVVAAGAALMVVARAAAPGVRVVAGALAVGFGAIPWGNGATAAAVLVLLLPVALLARPLGTRVRTVVLAAMALAVLGAAVPVALAATYTGAGPVDRLVASTLSERRPVLWQDAIAQVGADPWRGIGTGRFAEVSPTALDDRDAAWAHHAYLQLAGESGAPAGVLSLLLVLLLLGRLLVGPRDSATAVAAVSLAALSVLASIDYVLHFAAVLVVGVAVAGAGIAVQSAPAAVGRGRPSVAASTAR